MPAKAGIQGPGAPPLALDARFRGHDGGKKGDARETPWPGIDFPGGAAMNQVDPQVRLRSVDHVTDWIFDLDNTLYPAHCNLFAQVDRRIGLFIERLLGLERAAARELQKRYFREHGTTLRGLMTHHGVDPRRFLDFVHEIDLAPVPPSPGLDAALAALPGRKLIFTNGSVAHADRVMARLGVAHHFAGVFDIVAAAYLPKPDPATYRSLIARHGIDPARAAMIEDLPRNLRPAAALGMTTVLVLTGEDWASMDDAGDHIHHVTDDLVGWLSEHAPAAQSPGRSNR
jgi:putative hydrolase of the HAD superfamily